MSKRAPRALAGPPRRGALAGWALLPLRAFLGATFLFAGAQKLADPTFLSGTAPTSIHAQILSAIRLSPLHGALHPLLSVATAVGVAVAGAELLVGLATLLGLYPRSAASVGAALSLTFFLTVSYHSHPYYTGADIVFLAAWVPLIVTPGPPALSLGALIATRARRPEAAPAGLVALPFARVAQLCGSFDAGTCRARDGAPCAPAPCPVLAQPSEDPDAGRRAVLEIASGTLAAGAALIAGGAIAGAGRLIGGAPSGVALAALAPRGPADPAVGGTLLGPAHEVPVGGAATFTVPVTGDPGIVVQPVLGQFDAYDAVCPHAGCTVGYDAAGHVLACPCHGSQFQVASGAVLAGPAPRGLMKINLTRGPDGNLYVR